MELRMNIRYSIFLKGVIFHLMYFFNSPLKWKVQILNKNGKIKPKHQTPRLKASKHSLVEDIQPGLCMEIAFVPIDDKDFKGQAFKQHLR